MPALIPESGRPVVHNSDGELIKYMSIAQIRDNAVPRSGLWYGHWQKAMRQHDLYLMITGLGGAYKYRFLSWEVMRNQDVMIYTPVRQDRLPDVGVMEPSDHEQG